LGRLLIDFNDYHRTVFLAGTGRSGTTWVANIINYSNSYRLMFEPFNPNAVDIVGHFRYRQYLRPENKDPRYLEPANTILSGLVRNEWIDRLNRKVIARKRLVKDIRAHHLLKWIKSNFPEIPIILLLRHPCAVAHSKMKLEWDTQIEEFLSQDELVEDFLTPFKNEIENVQTVFEKHIIQWCIENFVPLTQFEDDEIHFAFYENFCRNPEYELDRLFTFLNEAYDSSIYDAVRRPSPLSRKQSAVFIGDDLVESWKRHIKDKQIHRSVEILSWFGLDSIYSDDPMPLINGKANPLAPQSPKPARHEKATRSN